MGQTSIMVPEKPQETGDRVKRYPFKTVMATNGVEDDQACHKNSAYWCELVILVNDDVGGDYQMIGMFPAQQMARA